jgi:DNA polymerase-1
MPKTLYLLDGHYQIYRSFYGLPQGLSSPAGEPTGATHVFFAMLFALLRQRKPDYLALVLDVSDETVFRREIDGNYKAQREPAPEALGVQINRIVSIVTLLGIPIYRVPGYEADDVMATIVERLRDRDDLSIYLVSRDKDLEQLLSDRVRLFDPTKSAEIDAGTLLLEKGYTPAQAVEVQTLVGDSTDNVPGVMGVGTKTAAKLIAQYGSAQNVVAHADDLTPKLAQKVKAYADKLAVTRRLVTLHRGVPLDFDLDACGVARLTPTAARPIFQELGFTRLMDGLDALGVRPPATPPPAPPAVIVERPIAVAYTLVDTPDKLDALAAELSRQPAFAFDTETTELRAVDSDLVGVSFAWRAGAGYYVPVRGMGGAVLPQALVAVKLKAALEDPAIYKVGQNVKFDMLVLRQLGIRVQNVRFDTLLAAFLLDPLSRSHSLDHLAKNLLNHDMIPITDLIGKGRDQIDMQQVDTARACEYAAEDADITWRLKELLEPRIAGSHVASLFHDIEMPLSEVLAEMEQNGVCLDVALLKKLGGSMEDRLIELSRDAHRAVGHSFNLDSPKQLAQVLFDELQLSVVRKTKTGRSTDADTLEALASQTDHPLPRLLVEYRELSKLKSTYIDTLPGMVSRRTGRVHASFNQTGAVTGRLSSNNPNLQNIPIRTETGREIRRAFVACDADHVLLSADYSQIELRLLAHFSKDQALRDAFESGQDIHRAVAAQVNGVSPQDVTPAQRSAAKAVNFGIIYGQTPTGLARGLGIAVSDARRFIDLYFLRYPGVRAFIQTCVTDARRKGYAETIFGRRRPIPQLTSRNRGEVGFGERIAVNTVVQGSAADLIKRAMIDIHREIQGRKWPLRMLIQVHDELVFEAPGAQAQQAADMIRQKMENAIPLDVPIVAETAWGANWAECK